MNRIWEFAVTHAWLWLLIIAHFAVLGTVAYLILLERKVASWVQDRLGPNRVGFEPEPGTNGLEFFGHSFISDPFGRILAEAGVDPAVLVATCDPRVIEDTRRNWPFLRDRRIDAYGPILNRYLG